MKFKYKFLIIFFTIFLFILGSVCYADDEDFEAFEFDINSVSVNAEASDEPLINSRAAIVYDRTSGIVLYGKNENDERKMASTTKIMTCIVVLENSNLDDIVEISKKSAGTGGSRLGLHTGDKISVKNLLYGLMLCSGNDAAVALAEHVGGDVLGFAKLMNSKAKSLGLEHTNFITPHGLDNDEHYTTAYELAKIADYALKNETFSKIVGTKTCTITINNYSKTLSNTNELLGILNGVYGVKTGFTNGANRCLVTSTKRNDMDIICVVLGADTKKDRTRDSAKLIEYCFNNFKMVNIEDKILEEFNNWKSCNINSFEIEKGISNILNLELEKIPYKNFPVNSNKMENIIINIYCTYNYKAPLHSNSSVGYLMVSIDNQDILKLNITNSNEIVKKNIFDYFKFLINNYITNLESIFFYK